MMTLQYAVWGLACGVYLGLGVQRLHDLGFGVQGLHVYGLGFWD